ncbi:MAG: alpha/beta fold hydrolase [Ruminococcaceae bacterium]|nr:alpha/beta fold hydrolase [Oscillospiraceae bacterium]
MIVAIIVATLLLLGVLGGAVFAYLNAFYAKGSKKKIKAYFEENEALSKAQSEMNRLISLVDATPFEEVYIKAYDGVKLYAKYYHIKDGAPIQIMMHGYKGIAKRDMCGGHYLAKKMGHNILLIDQRGCGNSGGKTVTFGVKERKDALSWVNYLTQRFGAVPIFLVGVSMGGATALMATDMDLPKNVVGAIADCPFSSPKAIIKKVCVDRGMPERIYTFVPLSAFLFGHFNPNKEGAVKSVKNAKIPYIILHGEKDGFVPFSMAQEIYDAGIGEKYLYSFKDADHGTSYMSDAEKYEAAVCKFVEKCLSSSKANTLKQ